MGAYAGQLMTTGAQAKTYADHFIAVHLQEMGKGQTYSQLSAASLKAPANTGLAQLVQTVFRGTTLRSMLLEAYGFWQMGQIALFAAIASFTGRPAADPVHRRPHPRAPRPGREGSLHQDRASPPSHHLTDPTPRSGPAPPGRTGPA